MKCIEWSCHLHALVPCVHCWIYLSIRVWRWCLILLCMCVMCCKDDANVCEYFDILKFLSTSCACHTQTSMYKIVRNDCSKIVFLWSSGNAWLLGMADCTNIMLRWWIAPYYHTCLHYFVHACIAMGIYVIVRKDSAAFLNSSCTNITWQSVF